MLSSPQIAPATGCYLSGDTGGYRPTCVSPIAGTWRARPVMLRHRSVLEPRHDYNDIGPSTASGIVTRANLSSPLLSCC